MKHCDAGGCEGMRVVGEGGVDNGVVVIVAISNDSLKNWTALSSSSIEVTSLGITGITSGNVFGKALGGLREQT